MTLTKYQSLKGARYIPLPDDIEAKKAVINVQINDNKCFFVGLLALHPANNHADEVFKYEDYQNELDFDGIEFTVLAKIIGVEGIIRQRVVGQPFQRSDESLAVDEKFS